MRSLRLKILAIVGVPVLALAISTTTFLVVLAQENRAEDAADRSVAIRQATQDVETAFQSVTGAIWGEAFGFGPGSGLTSTQYALNARLSSLRALLETQPRLLGLLSDFEAKVAAQVAISQRFAGEIVRTGRIPKLSASDLSDAATLTDTPQGILDEIAKTAEDSVAARRSEAEHARRRVTTVVVASGVVGTAAGLALIVFASTGIVRRIRRLGENARRLAAGQALLPFEAGRDEVGALGHELEEAARLLSEREEGMRRATDDADRANKAKSEFLSRMSHELRTPLNSILGFGQILEMSETDETRREDVHQILRAGRHLLALIDEVLDISGIEAGEVRFSMEPVCVHDVFDEVMALTKPIAEKNAVTVSAMPAETVWVRADRQRLKQVVLNLVANGIKYNRQGGTVSLGFALEGGSVRLDVTDSGRGLSDDDLRRLFVPFARLSVDPSIEGTGLGLALSKSLVDGMGGQMSVRSELGSGSVFSVILLGCEVPASEVGPADTPRVGETLSGEPLVLYIEDNLANLRLIERVLANSGVRLISAIKGTLGLELAAEHRPDVILLDLHLPDLSGAEVLRRLRADDRTADIPVIVISADATTNNEMRSQDTAAYLTKPLDVAEFRQVFESVLTSRRVA